MANQKLSDLTEKATLDGTELVLIVDDPGGTPVSKKTTAQAIAALGGETILAIKLDQSSTGDPNVTTLRDDIGFSITASRGGTGNYSVFFVKDGYVFPAYALFLSNFRGFVRAVPVDGVEWQLLTYNPSNTLADGILTNTYMILVFF